MFYHSITVVSPGAYSRIVQGLIVFLARGGGGGSRSNWARKLSENHRVPWSTDEGTEPQYYFGFFANVTCAFISFIASETGKKISELNILKTDVIFYITDQGFKESGMLFNWKVALMSDDRQFKKSVTTKYNIENTCQDVSQVSNKCLKSNILIT